MSSLRERLLHWYDGSARDLPWRHTKDPYRVWVSEIMLQQTRVETVIPYYERFLERFPDVESLADASEDDVLSAWSGLGYYRRARLLHAGVKEVVSRYGGKVPRDAGDRRGLPGVGRYTAGAIGSIAFDAEEPVVDGNVARFLSRLYGVDTPLGRADTDKRLWAEAGALVRGPRPGDLNQALMELGARVCRPRAPTCSICPASDECVARREGRAESLPVPRKRAEPKAVALTAVVATVGTPPRVFLVKSDEALYGGMWNVPVSEGSRPDSARNALRRHGIQARLSDDEVGTLTHVLSHRRLEVTVYAASHGRRRPSSDARAVTPEAMAKLGTSRLTRRILELVL